MEVVHELVPVDEFDALWAFTLPANIFLYLTLTRFYFSRNIELARDNPPEKAAKYPGKPFVCILHQPF
jgi:hypothetical protein